MPDIIQRLRDMSPFKNDQAGWLQAQEQTLAHR